jgi:lipopolysaccharide kinase (Kdo/WaaP) family protein
MIRHGTFWQRLFRGSRWTWLDERYREALPADLGETVMELDARERLHAKQGRSTARVVFHGPGGPVPVYLKRHFTLPWPSRLSALVHPQGRHTPGSAELAHLERARAMGVDVPEVVAAGERIGPWGRLQSFLMVAELIGRDALNEALPPLKSRLDAMAFEVLKRKLAREMAAITATLHAARIFHKDLYLCHFYIDPTEVEYPGISLIDLHRLGEHRWLADRWRWKDLGQLLYSTHGIDALTWRDAMRFWVHYQRRLNLLRPRKHLRMIAWKAARYARHNHDSAKD